MTMAQLSSEYLDLSLAILEVEQHPLSSFRGDLKVSFSNSNGSLIYSSNRVWFSFDDWNKFIEALSSGGGQFEVSDFSRDVEFFVNCHGVISDIEINLRRRIAGVGESITKIRYQETGHFREQLLGFARSVKAKW